MLLTKIYVKAYLILLERYLYAPSQDITYLFDKKGKSNLRT